MQKILITFFIALMLCSCGNGPQQPPSSQREQAAAADSLRYAEEKHLRNVRQLSFGGDNAEAYFSFAGDKLSFQRMGKLYDLSCDQIFQMSTAAPEAAALISTGKGRTTCSYFLPGDTLILYASTHLAADTCPQNPHMKDTRAYVWPLFDSYEIFVADLKGSIRNQLTHNKFYDAEATVSPRGDKIVFTSNRSGDLELYTMNTNGSDVKQITNDLGYDGGAFFSPDGSKLVFRASRPKTEEEQKNYKDLLAKGLVAPTNMEVFVCNADGSDMKQITDLGKANWAPYFHPSGNKIVFCSNHKSEQGFPFHLYMINVDGTGLEQITFDPAFDSFPMFSPDGKYLVFCSNRNNGGTRDTNVFLAEWVE